LLGLASSSLSILVFLAAICFPFVTTSCRADRIRL
jgi:hypothetical protein